MIIDHVSVEVSDIEAAKRFYDAALQPLGLVAMTPSEDHVGYVRDGRDDFYIVRSASGADIKPPARMHVALLAPSQQAVREFHAAAMSAGGREDGAPGLRPGYHAGYFGAFVYDPDGNRIEAVHHHHRPTTMTGRVLINIDVPSLSAAEIFYGTAFWLRVGRRFGPDFVELIGFDAPVYLLTKGAGTPPFAGAQATRAYERHWTPVHLDVVVEDLDAAVATAVAAGATLEQPATAHTYGRLALLRDPFGHGFCLLQFTTRGYDEIASPRNV